MKYNLIDNKFFGGGWVVTLNVLVDAALRHTRRYPLITEELGFNPCFDGCRPATLCHLTGLDIYNRFQSLFWWMPPCDPTIVVFADTQLSFNPCFDGCRPATAGYPAYIFQRWSFNPCFDGCRPATTTTRYIDVWCGVVSILVLMDAALRPRLAYFRPLLSTCFNPCFDGCRPATCASFEEMNNMNSFNPCFDGCRPATVSCVSISFASSTFQSLFWWMPPCDPENGWLSSILERYLFQSLFWWMPPCDFTRVSQSARGFCFNPCFDGCRPATIVCYVCYMMMRLSFNPCFDGCRPATNVQPLISTGLLEFQSLFWWMPPCDLSEEPTEVMFLSRFQSLFWWMPPCDYELCITWVVVYSSFNPCFDGCRPATWCVQHPDMHSMKFQSLFWWMPPCDGKPLLL